MRMTVSALAVAFAVVFLAGCGKRAPAKTVPVDKTATAVKTPPPAKPAVDPLAAAIAKAKKEKKNVLVEYYSPSCNFCTEMDKDVYPDAFVKEGLKGLVYVRLTQDKDGAPFEKRWTRLGTPSFVVLKPDGTQIGHTLTGKIEVDGMIRFLTWAAEPKGEMPAIETGGS